jgi:hypothetical protein
MRYYFEVAGDQEDMWGPFQRPTPDDDGWVIVLWQNDPGKEFMEQTTEANLAISTKISHMGWLSVEADSYDEAANLIKRKFGVDDDVIFVTGEDVDWQ